MFGPSTIRRLLTGVLLLLFALSITPKVFVHALVAHHQDRHLSIGHDASDQVNKAGYHCNVENLVVELPCLIYPISIQLPAPQLFRDYQVEADHQFYSFGHFIFGVRGPPTAV